MKFKSTFKVLGLKDELDRLQLEAVEKERAVLKSKREADQRLAAAEAERDNAGNTLEVVGQVRGFLCNLFGEYSRNLLGECLRIFTQPVTRLSSFRS